MHRYALGFGSGKEQVVSLEFSCICWKNTLQVMHDAVIKCIENFSMNTYLGLTKKISPGVIFGHVLNLAFPLKAPLLRLEVTIQIEHFGHSLLCSYSHVFVDHFVPIKISL